MHTIETNRNEFYTELTNLLDDLTNGETLNLPEGMREAIEIYYPQFKAHKKTPHLVKALNEKYGTNLTWQGLAQYYKRITK